MADIAALNTVYNHFMTTYAPRGVSSRYDTHKKSELRGVYNSIVKMNKDAPLFLLDNSDSAKEFAVGLKEETRALKNTISSVSTGGANLLSKKAVASSDESIVTASYIGELKDESEAPTLNIEVKALASGQENTGKMLPENEMGLESNSYSFDIRSRDMDYEFQFNIGDNDTNRSIEEKLARLITKSNIGIKASTVEDGNGNIGLLLESTETGTKAEGSLLFKVSDDRTSKASGVVDYFGLDNVTKMPANSSFVINGEEKSTMSNQFSIEHTYELTLNGINKDEEPVTIGLKTDVESISENISYLIEGYNSFLNKAAAYLDKQPYSQKVVDEMGSIAKRYGNDLEAIGLMVQDNGTISLDKNLLEQTAREDDALKRFNTIKDFTQNVLGKADTIFLNPMAYTQKTIVAYKNPGHNFATPYITSNYSGMMFSSYC